MQSKVINVVLFLRRLSVLSSSQVKLGSWLVRTLKGHRDRELKRRKDACEGCGERAGTGALVVSKKFRFKKKKFILFFS